MGNRRRQRLKKQRWKPAKFLKKSRSLARLPEFVFRLHLLSLGFVVNGLCRVCFYPGVLVHTERPNFGGLWASPSL